MASIKKPIPMPHVVITDTSTLWFEDKHFAVDPLFDTFVKDYASPFSLEIKVPEVVRGELLFQQTTSALNSLKRANAEIDSVSKVTCKSYSHRVTDERVKKEVEAKLDNWVGSIHAQVVATPTNTIQWPVLVQQAIWRKPPFTFNSKDKDNEKGFRDALILETIISLVSRDTRKVQFAFLCKDKLLRETAEERLALDPRFSAYELIQDLRSYLDLTKEALEDKFIKAIMARASQKFFVKEESDSLYYRDNIRLHLKEKYASYFENPEMSEQRPGLRRGLLGRPRGGGWEPTDSGMFWIGRSQYVERSEENIYIWKNELNHVRRYSQKSTGDDEDVRTQLLVLTFQIKWKSRVTTNGRFMSYEFLDDELSEKAFRKITDEDIVNWHLD